MYLMKPNKKNQLVSINCKYEGWRVQILITRAYQNLRGYEIDLPNIVDVTL
jgi:hypothetical protein